jgi:hypothetical protein
MTKLTDTQLVILTAACQRPNQLALPLPEHLRGGAAQKIIGALLAKGLLAEVAAGRDDPIWHENKDGQGVTLVAPRPRSTLSALSQLTGPQAPHSRDRRRRRG